MDRTHQVAFTCPREFFLPAAELVDQPDLGSAVIELDWNQVRTVEFQEGSGISLCFAGAVVFEVCPEWLQANLGPLVELLLAC